MLKKISWIVALLAALTIGLIGCTNAAFDWEPPTEQLDENALQVVTKDTYVGIDLNDSHFSFSEGDIIQVTGKTLGKNKMNFHAGESGADLFWEQNCNPDEEFDSEKVTLTAAQASSAAAEGFIRVQGNTNGAAYIIYNITVTRGGEEIYNLYEKVLKSLTPGEQDRKKIFDGMIGDEEQHGEGWISPADFAGATGVWTVLGPGYGGAKPTKLQEYTGGDLTKAGNNIKFTAGTTVLYGTVKDDKVEDLDPFVLGVGPGVTVDPETGVVSVKLNEDMGWSGGAILYKFPESYYTNTSASKVRWDKNALDLETDFDYIQIDATVSNVVAPVTGFDVKMVQYEGGWDGANYKLANAGQWDQYGGFGSGGAGTINVQTWPAGGKGGIEIHFNTNNTLKAGGADLKINKVTFTKGVRYTVKYYSPQSGYAGLSQQVLSGNPPRPPALSLAGYTFLGWFDDWNPSTGSVPSSATEVTGTASTITANTNLFGKWYLGIPTLVSENNPTFTAGSTTNTPTVTYDGKSWFLIAATGSEKTITGPPTADFTTEIAAITGKGVVYYTLASLLTSTPFNVASYTSVRVTYDTKFLDNSTGGYVMRAGTSEGSDPIGGYSNAFENGDDKTLTVPLVGGDGGDFTTTWGFQEAYGDNHAYLIRFTKIELLP